MNAIERLRSFFACSATVLAYIFVAIILANSQTLADDLKTYTTDSNFDDVVFDINNAIIDNGLKLETNGKVAQMLKRTGADVGSTKPIYKNAEYFTFCSAKLSRQMMEADPSNLAHCPFVVFVYEAQANPGKVVVGYKPHPKTGTPKSLKAFAAIDALLDKIVKEVVE